MAKRITITALILMVIVATSLYGPGALARPVKAPKSARITAPAQPQTTVSPLMRMYGAYWKTGNGYTTTLVFSNKDQQNPVTASITLFSAAGKQLQTSQIQIAPESVSRLNISDLVHPQGNSMESGGLMVDSTGPLSGALMVEGPQTGSITLPLNGGYRYDTENALYTPWWLPDDGSDGSLTVFNSSGEKVTVTPSVFVAGGAEQSAASLSLAPHASTVMSLRNLIGKSSGIAGSTSGILTLRYSGPTHALFPTLLLANSTTGFSLAPEFNARHRQQTSQQVTWQYPQVSLVSDSGSASPAQTQSLTAYALLSNGTANSIAPEIMALYAMTGGKRLKKTPLPVSPVLPGETRLVNLSQLLSTAAVPSSVPQFALTVSHGGNPGDLAIAIFSVSQDKSVVLSSDGTTQPAGVIDSSYWNLAKPQAVPGVVNKNKVDAQAQVTMYYQTAIGLESYMLPVIAVAASKHQPLGLRGIMNTGVTDSAGNKVPPGISAGLVTLTVVSGSGAANSPGDSGPECPSDCNTLAATASVTGSSSVSTATSVSPSSTATLPSSSSTSTTGQLSTPGVQFDSSGCVPVITNIDPDNGDPGDPSFIVTITGENFEDGDEVSVTGDVIVGDTSVNLEGTEISVEFQIPSTATPGDQTVTVLDVAGESNGVTFTINTPPAPIIESIDQTSGTVGDLNIQATITMSADGPWRDGDNIQITGNINLSPNGDPSPDGLQVPILIQIGDCNAVGDQQITITDQFGQTSNAITFTVNSPPAPNITGISPNELHAGASDTLIITGTNLMCTQSVSSPDGNLKFGQFTFADETQTSIQVPVTDDPNDPGGQVNVVINTSSGGRTAGSSALRTGLTTSGRTINGGAGTKAGTQTKSSSGSKGKAGTSIAPAKSGTGGTRKNQISPGPKGTLIAGGGGGSNAFPITIDPFAAPTPQIMFLGNDIANNTTPQTVYIGQQIALTAQINLPDQGLFIFSENWSTPSDSGQLGSLPQGTAIAGYDDRGSTQPPQPTTAGGYVETLQSTLCSVSIFDPSCPYNTFYWIDEGNNRQFTFTYKLLNGQQASATATFNVIGPTNPNMTAVPGHSEFIDTTPIATNPNLIVVKMRFGGPGMAFQFTANGPDPASPGTDKYSFVQVISENSYTIRDDDQVRTCRSTALANGPALDTFFPYPFTFPFPTKAEDSPGVTMNQSDNSNYQYAAEVSRSFKAKMYLMWDPGLMANGQGGCTPAVSHSNPDGTYSSNPSTCTGSIPVPLGFVQWAFTQDGVNKEYGIPLVNQTRQNHTTFDFACSNNTTNPTFQQDTEIPKWQTSFVLNPGVCN